MENNPHVRFDNAMSLIRQARDVLCEFREHIRKIDKLFTKTVLKVGDSCTPSLRAKCRKQLAKALPDRPDWREMAKELEGRS
jgi:hypothetical protein